MVNKPLIRPYFLGGGSFGGGPARIPMKHIETFPFSKQSYPRHLIDGTRGDGMINGLSIRSNPGFPQMVIP